MAIASTRAPLAFAAFTAASVSAVSPLWLTATMRSCFVKTGSRYRTSLPISTCAGIFASCSTQYRPAIAACELVPHATK